MSQNPAHYEALNLRPRNAAVSSRTYIASVAGGEDTGPGNHVRLARGWVPEPLHAWFWIPLVTFMILSAISLEIALHYNRTTLGWATFYSMNVAPDSTFGNYYHYAYTQPPIIVSMVVVALWAWVAIEIQMMQPYIDLVHGHATAKRSILLDYMWENKFIVWISAFSNRHYTVAVVTLVAILALVIQPLCGSVFILKNTWWGPDLFNVTSLFSISLNEGPDYLDLTAFVSAAGYASSSVLYNFSDPSFIYDMYTVAPFEMPSTNGGFNGTVNANTTAIKTNTNCYPMVMSTQISGGSWVNTATFGDCIYNFTVNTTVNNPFGADVMPNCNSTGAASFCTPEISLFDVSVVVDMNDGSLTSVLEIQPFNASTLPLASLSQNVTGPPLNGEAFNGISFNLTNPDEYTVRRSNATTLQLSASILQVIAKTPGGVTTTFQTNNFTGTATMVYGTYLQAQI